ncbi:type IV secretion system protein [sulfur-oxidizing endosymbiont of Gigantopelta aegis]|uniref:type IV secretion system protein n=1 Tax=sulfur-oxidizing endosymbiont of Gigantopelta aegis TaxID=2794934 RepID=UPI0018DCB13E|nr:type IV secretion system protein [sulfur-oxidizing endosymbiont of Gigantopelta aegis]
MALTFFQDTFTNVDEALANYIVNASDNLITTLTPIFTSMMIIWITIWGYMAMMGRIEGLLQDSFFKILKVAFIITLGLKTAQYNEIIVPFLQGMPEQIASTISGNPTSNIYGLLDNIMNSIYSAGKSSWDRGGMTKFSPLIIALIIWGFGGFMVVLLGALLMLSKVAITLLLAIGPIFIIATLFQSTQRFFDSWIGVLMNQSFTLILVAGIGSIFTTIGNNYISSRLNPSTADAFGVFIIYSMLIYFIQQIPSLAASLGAGFGLSISGMMSRFTSNVRTGKKLFSSGARAVGKGLNHIDRTPAHIENLKNKIPAAENRFRDSNRLSAAAYRKFRPNRISGN